LGQQDGYKGLKDKQGNKFGTRDWFKDILAQQESKRTLTEKELTAMKKAWDAMPKDSEGKVDINKVYDAYMNNRAEYLSDNQLAFLKEVMDWKEQNLTGKQKAANEFRGKGFDEILFHTKRIRKDQDGKSLATSPIEISQNGNVRIAAGSGKEVLTEEVGAIEHNFEKIFSNNLEETMRDYYVTPMLQEVSATLNKAKKEAGNKKAGYVDAMKLNTADAVNNEFAAEQMSNVNRWMTVNLPRAKAAQVLIAPIRTVGELVSSLVSYPLRTKEFRSYAELFKKKDTVAKLLNETDSPYKDKANLNKHFDIQEGQLKEQSTLDKLTMFFAALPERMGLQPIWMASFDTAFEQITGKSFDREAYLNNPTYAKQNAKAISDAGAQADQKYSEIAGGTTKASQRRTVKFLPKVKGVKANSAEGRILSFMSGYPFRETQTIAKSVKAMVEASKDTDTSKAGVGKEALPIVGSFLGAVTYGLYQTLSYEIQKMAFGDEEDEQEAKETMSALFTPIGMMKEASASFASLMSSRYSGAGRQMLKLLGTITMNIAEKPEDKSAIRSMVRNITFQDPLELKYTKNGKLIKYGLRGELATQIADVIVPASIMIDNTFKAIETLGGIEYLANKVESGEALTEPEKEALVLTYIAVNLSNAVAMFFGKAIPPTTINKLSKRIIEEKQKEAEQSSKKQQSTDMPL
jgi:hypothetical protein